MAGTFSQIYIKSGEAFAFHNKSDEPIELIAGVCPECSSPEWLPSMPDNFDSTNKKRTVSLHERKIKPTDDRFYALLVGKKMGSHHITQFIGLIPKSKGPEHHHLYEEALTILSGKGYMWAGKKKTAVGPGSAIFLPRKQVHCLEATTDEGIMLTGLIYPAGSPIVSY